MTITTHNGPLDPEKEWEEPRDTLPETPHDPNDTRDPGDAETDPDYHYQTDVGEGGAAGGQEHGGS